MSHTAGAGSRKKAGKPGGTGTQSRPNAGARTTAGQGASKGSGKRSMGDRIPKKNPSASTTRGKAGVEAEDVDSHADEKTVSRAGDGNGGNKGDDASESVPPKDGDDSSDSSSGLSQPPPWRVCTTRAPIPGCVHAVHYADLRERDQYNLSIMFTKLGVPQSVVHAIVHEQQYDDPGALSCLMAKKVEQLVATICRPGGMKDGEKDPRVNVPLHTQEIIASACFALKDQRCRGFHPLEPLLVTPHALDNLCLQQEIEEAHNNEVLLKNRPK